MYWFQHAEICYSWKEIKRMSKSKASEWIQRNRSIGQSLTGKKSFMTRTKRGLRMFSAYVCQTVENHKTDINGTNIYLVIVIFRRHFGMRATRKTRWWNTVRDFGAEQPQNNKSASHRDDVTYYFVAPHLLQGLKCEWKSLPMHRRERDAANEIRQSQITIRMRARAVKRTWKLPFGKLCLNDIWLFPCNQVYHFSLNFDIYIDKRHKAAALLDHYIWYDWVELSTKVSGNQVICYLKGKTRFFLVFYSLFGLFDLRNGSARNRICHNRAPCLAAFNFLMKS